MFNWFKKRVKGAAAQINPFDGGKTYSSVVNEKPKVQARPTPQSRPSPAIQVPQAPRQNPFNQSLNNFASLDTPKLQAPKQQTLSSPALDRTVKQGEAGSGVLKPEVLQKQRKEAIRQYIDKKKPGLNQRADADRRARQIYNQQSLREKVADNLFNANSRADRAKRVARGESADYVTQQRDLGRRSAPNNFVKRAADMTVGSFLLRPATTGGALIRAAPDTIKSGIGYATGNREAELNASRRAKAILRERLNGEGILGTGSLVRYGEARDMSAGDVAKRATTAGVEGAMDALPMTKGFKIGMLGKTPGRELAKNVAADYTMGVAGDAARQYDETGEINIPQTLVSGAVSAGTGAASYGAGRGFQRVRGATPDRPRTSVRESLDNVRSRVIKPLDESGHLQLPSRKLSRANRGLAGERIRPLRNEANVLSDYQEMLLGRTDPRISNQLHRQARELADKYGIDVTSGSVFDINNRINDLIENGVQPAPVRPSMLDRIRDRFALDESGHVQLGGYGDDLRGRAEVDPLEGRYISEQVAHFRNPEEYRQNLIDTIWDNNKKGKGTNTYLKYDDTGYNIIGRATESYNDPFYQAFYREYGRKPTKTEITQMIDDELAGKSTLLSKNMEMSPVDKDIYAQLKEQADANRALLDSEPQTSPYELAERMQQVSDHAKQKGRKVYEATGDVAQAKAAHNKVVDRAREINSSQAGVRQSTGRGSPSDSQGYTRSQSQSASSSQRPRPSEPSAQGYRGDLSATQQKQAQPQTRTLEKPPIRQNPYQASSSDNIIDLKTIDVNDPFNNNSPVQRFRNEFGKLFIDEDAEMINLLKRVEKETESKDLVERWLQDTDLVRGSNSIANSKIRNNKNLGEAISGLRKRELAELDQYAAARSELSNLKRGLSSTSRSADTLNTIVNKHGSKYGKRFDALNRYYNDLAKDLHEAGIIDKAKLDSWSKNKDYVRVQRDMEDLLNPGYGSSRSRSFGSTSTVKKRTGSQREILSTTETALKRTQELQLEIQRNKAASNTIDVLSKYGIAEKVPQSQAGGKNIIKRFKDGKVEYFATNKDIKRVIDNVNPFQLGVVAKVLSAPTRLFRAGTTGLSAPFAVTNYARDQVSSGIYSKAVLSTHNPKTIASGIYQGIKDFGGGQNSELWEKFQKYAGDQTIFDQTRNARSTKQVLTELRRGGGKKARAAQLINPINTARNLEDLIGITEKSTRFQNFRGIYEKSLRDGLGEDVAIQRATQAALQNSVNFSRAGSVVRVANLMLPYFNAGVQGSRNIARSFRDRPVSSISKSIAFVGLPTVGSVMFNYSNDESRRIYENISETEKADNFIFVLPGAKQRSDGTYEGIIKVPKPQGYRELTDPIRKYTEGFASGEQSKGIAEMAKDMLPAITGPIQTEDMNKFKSTFIPQIAKPALQAIDNKDFYWGSDTVPDYMMDGTEDPTKRAYKNTSGTARFIANKLGVSPIKVEKFIIDSSGSLGRYGINAADSELAKRGFIPKEQIGGRSIGDDFKRRVTEARGIEKEPQNMTSGQKYFKDVQTATAGLNKQQKTAWDSYNQSNKNFLGEELYGKSAFAKKQAKASAYVQFPELFEVDKKMNDLAKRRGEPSNPLYELSYEQALKVVHKKALPPGAKDDELSNLYSKEWYSDFKAKETAFYDKIFKGKRQTSDNPYPEQSAALSKKMDYYNTLPKGTGARKAFLAANPDIIAHWDKVEAWTNRERKKIGLDALEDDGFGYTSKFAYSGGGGRKSSTPKYASRKSEISAAAQLAKLASNAGKGLKAQKPTYKKTNTKTKSKSLTKKLARASTRGKA